MGKTLFFVFPRQVVRMEMKGDTSGLSVEETHELNVQATDALTSEAVLRTKALLAFNKY